MSNGLRNFLFAFSAVVSLVLLAVGVAGFCFDEHFAGLMIARHSLAITLMVIGAAGAALTIPKVAPDHRRLVIRGALVAIVLLICAGAIYPVEKQIRYGKDLRGGTSLVYSVQIAANEDPKDVIGKTIEALKRRVDPDGLMEISMVQAGNDRIEITMPLPSEDVKQLKKDFENRLAQLGRNKLTEARVDLSMRMPKDQRDKELTELSSGNADRLKLLNEAAAAYDDAAAKRAAMQAEPDPAKKDALVAEVANAETKYDEARKKVLATALTAEEIRKVVTASTRARTIGVGADSVTLPSPRDQLQKQLYDSHPDAKAEIDSILASYKSYADKRTTLDDPNDLVRMIKGAGVLAFRITVDPDKYADEARLRRELHDLGPKNVKSTDVHWYKINQIDGWVHSKAQIEALTDPAKAEAYTPVLFKSMGYVAEYRAGEYYMLCWDTHNSRLTANDGQWSVARASQGTDQLGRPSINFEMSPAGGVLLGQLTGQHVNDHMAVLLDDEVYTAPNLKSEIGIRGEITGEFTPEEVNYIRRVLSGGSLQAKLSPEPISTSTIGPQLGADNLTKGKHAGAVAMIVITSFMIVYYWGLGLTSVFSLAVNAVLIIGCMALSRAAFTMPGIAGIILTFGMAVDSNVLVFERMREEFNRGADMKTAVRLGFDRALASIVDGNVTNLIVCVVLYYTGTPEIRGFAITLGIGVVATLFATLVATRWLITTLVAMGWTRTSMLAMAVPAVQHALTPHINWMRMRYGFFTISAIYVGLGLAMVFYQGKGMLDNEFLGGTQVTLQFKHLPGSEERATMKREEVKSRVEEIGKAAPANDELKKLEFAEVLPINPQSDNVTSTEFEIKTVAVNSKAVTEAIVEKFADKLETKPRVDFDGAERPVGQAPAYPVEKPVLGADIPIPSMSGLRNDVSKYLGGVAIVLDKLSPPPTLESLKERLSSARQGEQFSDTLARPTEVIITDGNEQGVKSAVVLAADDAASLFDNEAKWDSDVKTREWALVQEALTKPSTPASVHNFSPTIADTFRKDAILACLASFLGIGIYIWVRFKQPRYAIGAVVALVHDVLTVVGLLAICEILYDHDATRGFAQSLGLLPFKIDLNTVAALLTISGYSLNDTVIVMDRIRENRGKLPLATAKIINDSINQTISRTLITSGTTLFCCLTLYVLGGEGVRPFAFALTTGMIVGTYSSVAVASPIVLSRKANQPSSPGGGGGAGSSSRELVGTGA